MPDAPPRLAARAVAQFAQLVPSENPPLFGRYTALALVSVTLLFGVSLLGAPFIMLFPRLTAENWRFWCQARLAVAVVPGLLFTAIIVYAKLRGLRLGYSVFAALLFPLPGLLINLNPLLDLARGPQLIQGQLVYNHSYKVYIRNNSSGRTVVELTVRTWDGHWAQANIWGGGNSLALWEEKPISEGASVRMLYLRSLEVPISIERTPQKPKSTEAPLLPVYRLYSYVAHGEAEPLENLYSAAMTTVMIFADKYKVNFWLDWYKNEFAGPLSDAALEELAFAYRGDDKSGTVTIKGSVGSVDVPVILENGSWFINDLRE